MLKVLLLDRLGERGEGKGTQLLPEIQLALANKSSFEVPSQPEL